VSVTEGDDKPVKYPHMFRAADLVLINKIDLLPHVDFSVGTAVRLALEVNPRGEVMTISARTGEGLADWYAWLQSRRSAAGGRGPAGSQGERERSRVASRCQRQSLRGRCRLNP
jgi:hydrogenase nickel incorporation protein HypB